MTLDDALRECLVLPDIAADLDAATGGFAKVLPVAKAIAAEGVIEIPSERMQEVLAAINAHSPNI
jgi:proteasome beta subunit